MDTLDLANPAVVAALQFQDQHATENIRRIFVSRHPELLNVSKPDDIANENAINKVIVENRWQYTPESLEAAYTITRQRGELVVNDLAHPSPQLQAVFDRMSTAQQREFFAAQQEPSRPRNLADELLTGEGSFRWNKARGTDTPALDDAALAALRNSLSGKKQ